MKYFYYVFIIVFALMSKWVVAEDFNIIRDDEIENYVALLINKIYSKKIQFFIYDSRDINAFVTSNDVMFISSELIKTSDNYAMLASVLAHEIGHITSGHIFTKADQTESLVVQQIAGVFLSAAASAINPELGMAAASIGYDVIAKNFLTHSREQEEIADNQALQTMRRAKIPIAGMIDMFSKIYHNYDLGYVNNVYTRTHPVTTNRIMRVKQYKNITMHDTTTNIFDDKNFDSSLQNQHQVSMLKLKAWGKNKIDNKIIEQLAQPKRSLIEAIVLYKSNKLAQAIQKLEQQKSVFGEYEHEFLGYLLFANGELKKAAAQYMFAIEQSKHENVFIKAAYAHINVVLFNDTGELSCLNKAEKYFLYALDKEKYSVDFVNGLIRVYKEKSKNSDLDKVKLLYYQGYKEMLRGNNKQVKLYVADAMKIADKKSGVYLKLLDLEDMVH